MLWKIVTILACKFRSSGVRVSVTKARFENPLQFQRQRDLSCRKYLAAREMGALRNTTTEKHDAVYVGENLHKYRRMQGAWGSTSHMQFNTNGVRYFIVLKETVRSMANAWFPNLRHRRGRIRAPRALFLKVNGTKLFSRGKVNALSLMYADVRCFDLALIENR